MTWKIEAYGMKGQEPYGWKVLDLKTNESIVQNDDGYFPLKTAALIAAAPEMIAFLEKIKAMLVFDFTNSSPEILHELNRIIAKADGK